MKSGVPRLRAIPLLRMILYVRCDSHKPSPKEVLVCLGGFLDPWILGIETKAFEMLGPDNTANEEEKHGDWTP